MDMCATRVWLMQSLECMHAWVLFSSSTFSHILYHIFTLIPRIHFFKDARFSLRSSPSQHLTFLSLFIFFHFFPFYFFILCVDYNVSDSLRTSILEIYCDNSYSTCLSKYIFLLKYSTLIVNFLLLSNTYDIWKKKKEIELYF